MMRFKEFLEQDGPSVDLDQTRRILGISTKNWNKTADKGGVYALGNYLFPNGLWFGSVSVEVISPPIMMKDKKGKQKPYVKVKVLASKAANKEMIYRYKDGKPQAVNGDVGDFVVHIPQESLIGFGLDQAQGGPMGAGGMGDPMGGLGGGDPMAGLGGGPIG